MFINFRVKQILGKALLVAGLLQTASAQYGDWRHTGSIWVLTTPEGADLPASASETDFPVLLRLRKGDFDFSQAKGEGEDLRFSTSNGVALAYQIEEWQPAAGSAAIWVRLPTIKGNDRQEIKMHWGKADAASESEGGAVFNRSNGHLSVWHMNDPVKDEVGTVKSKDKGTTATGGMIGQARHFDGEQGISGGRKITSYPSGKGPMTTEAWFRAKVPNSTVLAWGKEQRPGKVMMNFLSPPRIAIQCYFADVEAKRELAVDHWYHVVHTYQDKDSRVYIDGKLEGATRPVIDIPTTSGLWIGGWYDNYSFIGDIDEVRISNVVRSADWIKLEYENQKPMQTLVGPVVRPGHTFSLSHSQVTVNEGQSATLTAKADGAIKIYWILKSGEEESTVATDQFTFTLDAGRLTENKASTLRCKAIFPNEVKTGDVSVRLIDSIQEPIFTLKAPATWDGRTTIEVTPQITNLSEMQAMGAGPLKMDWSISDIAVTQETTVDKLVLKRAQNSGKMTVTAKLSNGGKPTIQTATIVVNEPESDPWVDRIPDKEEQPEDSQFYARDRNNQGTLIYQGTMATAGDTAFIKVYADDKLYKSERAGLAADRSYSFAIKLEPGLIRYKVEFGTIIGGSESILRTVDQLVCGDAFIINGQSNAVSTDWGEEEPPAFRSPWIRTFGSPSAHPKDNPRWGEAVYRSNDDGNLQIGYWPMELAKRLVESHKMPICMINGAVGGTRIDQHPRNEADPTDAETIYGRLLWRVREARLTHGIRGIFWHQGENDQGAGGSTGRYGWETYRELFLNMAAAWKQDYPNLQRYWIFQIWPRSCAMGVEGSDNRLREVQRNLPAAFSNMSILSTLGIEPPGPCHFPPAGYSELARQIFPLVERDFYGFKSAVSLTPPNLLGAKFAGNNGDRIVLEFDQPLLWDNVLTNQFYLDGESDRVASGQVSGRFLTLKLKAGYTHRTITYLDSKSWSQQVLLRGENGIAALTFCEVPLAPAKAGH